MAFPPITTSGFLSSEAASFLSSVTVSGAAFSSALLETDDGGVPISATEAEVLAGAAAAADSLSLDGAATFSSSLVEAASFSSDLLFFVDLLFSIDLVSSLLSALSSGFQSPALTSSDAA